MLCMVMLSSMEQSITKATTVVWLVFKCHSGHLILTTVFLSASNLVPSRLPCAVSEEWEDSGEIEFSTPDFRRPVRNAHAPVSTA